MLRVYLGLIIVAGAYPLGILLLGSDEAVGAAVIIGTVTVAATLLLGLPLALWFVQRGWVKFWQVALAGALVGLLCALPFVLGTTAEQFLQSVSRFAAFGLAHSAAFWLLAIYRNSSLSRLSQAASKQASTPGAA
jgi:hypothetical protein